MLRVKLNARILQISFPLHISITLNTSRKMWKNAIYVAECVHCIHRTVLRGSDNTLELLFYFIFAPSFYILTISTTFLLKCSEIDTGVIKFRIHREIKTSNSIVYESCMVNLYSVDRLISICIAWCLSFVHCICFNDWISPIFWHWLVSGLLLSKIKDKQRKIEFNN